MYNPDITAKWRKKKNNRTEKFIFILLVNASDQVVLKNTTRLCATKPIVTVNGQFPGPTLYAREDDNVLLRVTNHVQYNVTIHWHGVRQLRTGWPKRDTPLACTYFLAEVNHVWCHCYLAKKGVPYPFPKPDKEKIIILGEWWKADTEAVVNQAMQTGLPPNISDAHTINGHSVPVPNCSSEAVNEELFFKIAGHDLTVVEVDASYTKPFKTDTLFLGPGQTTTALLTADQGIGKYLIAVSPFMDTIVAVDNLTGIGFLRYNQTLAFTPTTLTSIPPVNATSVTSVFTKALRSLNSKEYPANVPLTVDHSLLFTIGVGINSCARCFNGSRAIAAINNISFDMPTTALLQAHYYGISGVFTDDFPAKPIIPCNYTVGRGLGNFDPGKDPQKFNLVDPVERNTVSVPTAGWTAIRFRADNPGVWFFHCHLEVHTIWGLKMAFLVDNGKGPNESIPPPPSDLPQC
ncbi:hypothetical protein CRYUN_Cryun09bG0106000 [Craigia yunnanensis]